MSRPIVPRALVIGAVVFVISAAVMAGPVASPTSPLTWLRGLAAFLLLGWFPGWALGRLLGCERPDLHRSEFSRPNVNQPEFNRPDFNRSNADLFALIGLPLAFSPILSTGLLVLGSLAGSPVQQAVWLPVMVTPVLLLASAWFGGRGATHVAPTATPRTQSAARPAAREWDIALFSLLIVFLLVAINLANPWLRWRADGRFHIGVTAEILRGGLPPTDPFFAGLNLQYMWFFHAWLAGLKSLSGASTSWLMVGTNMVGLLAFLTLAATLARELGRSRAGTWITLLVTGFGMGGLSWALVPVKLLGVFTGEKRGMEEFRALFHLWPPTIQQELGFLSAGYDQPFLLRKFLVGTAMSLALSAILLQIVLIRRGLERGGVRWLPVLAIVSTGAIILHPMVGIPAVAVGLVAALLAPVLARLIPSTAAAPDAHADVAPGTHPAATPGAIGWAKPLAIVAASVAGVAMAMPYLSLVTGGKESEGGLPIDFFPMKVICLLVGSAGLSIPVLLGATRWWRSASKPRHDASSRHDASPTHDVRRNPGEAWLIGWALLLFGFALFVKFPLERSNIDKPTLLVHLSLALVAGGFLGAWWDAGTPRVRRNLIVYLFLLIVPTHLVLLGTYLVEADPRTYRAHEREAHAWLREHAPATAIVFDSLDRDRPGVEIPRRMLWSHEQFAITHQYPVEEMDGRRAIRDALYAGFGTGKTAGESTGDGTAEIAAGPDAVTWLAVVYELRALPGETFAIVRAGEARPGATGEPFGTGPVVGSFAAGDPDPLDHQPAFGRVFDSDDTRVYRLLK